MYTRGSWLPGLWIHSLLLKLLTLSVSVHLRLPRSLKVHSTFHVSKLKPVKDSPLVPSSAPPLPLWFIDGGPVFTVRKLLGVCNRGRGKQFLVDWEKYGPEEQSLIPSHFIVDKSLIRHFYTRHQKIPGTSGAGPRGEVLS